MSLSKFSHLSNELSRPGEEDEQRLRYAVDVLPTLSFLLTDPKLPKIGSIRRVLRRDALNLESPALIKPP